MKKITTLFTAAILFALVQTASAQTRSGRDITINCDKIIFREYPKFECKQFIYNNKTRVMTLTDDVSLKTEKFEFADAGKVVYDQKTKKVKIYDCKEFTIDGKVVVKDNISKVKIVEYTLGEDTVYIVKDKVKPAFD